MQQRGTWRGNPLALQTQLNFLFQRIGQLAALEQPGIFERGVVSDFLFAKDAIFATLTLDDDDLALYRQIHQRQRSNMAGSPVQWSSATARPAFFRTWRSTSATTTTSSSGPTTGMNSGMRSIGEITQSAANPRSHFDPRGTRGSRARPFISRTRSGRTFAAAIAIHFRPLITSTAMTTAHTPRAMSTMTTIWCSTGPAYGVTAGTPGIVTP